MHQEKPTRDPAFRRHPRALAAAITLPVLFATGAFVLNDTTPPDATPRSSLAPAAEAAQGDLPRPDIAATFAAYLDRAPEGEAYASLAEDSERSDVRKVLQSVYEERGYRPIWFDGTRPTPAAHELVAALRDARADGLDPHAYPTDSLERRLESLGDRPVPVDVLETDALLSQTLMVYGEHLATGRVDPRSLGPAWLLEPRKPDLATGLEAVADSGELAPALSALRPPHPAYQALRRALAHYREIQRAGGWPSVPEGATLAPGDTGDRARLEALARRLEAEGDLAPGAWQPTTSADDPGRALYNQALADAVERYQRRMGLEVDGKLGPNTVANLNLSVSHRLRQIELNLERWRWLPADLGERRIEVNLPAFLLDTVDGGRVTSTMKVVVGKAGAATPSFSDEMTYLVINPYWNVPESILASEIAPKAASDPSYLSSHGYEVVQGWGDSERPVDPYAIDWSAAQDGRGQFRVRQRPGRGNALGRVKFMFPNAHNIYLHDTSAPSLFNRTRRAFSHGCIRVERPLDLAAFVLQGDPAWSRSRVRSTIARGDSVSVRLPQQVPVYLLYWTAWVDDGGTVHFRNDVYGHDRDLDRALDRL